MYNDYRFSKKMFVNDISRVYYDHSACEIRSPNTVVFAKSAPGNCHLMEDK